MQSDWSRRVQYWPYCDLTLNIVLFDKKTAKTTFIWDKVFKNGPSKIYGRLP